MKQYICVQSCLLEYTAKYSTFLSKHNNIQSSIFEGNVILFVLRDVELIQQCVTTCQA
jgi:hypothetical protein